MSSNHSSIYMRGLFDGLREGMSPEMTPKKFKMTLDGQTSICKKIFEFVPKTEAWTAQTIVTAMSRSGSTRPDLKTAEGCLNSLKDSGLIKETDRGLFQAIVPRETPAPIGEHIASLSKVPIEIKASNAIPPETLLNWVKPESPAPKVTPAMIFGAMADALRAQAAGLLKMADDIDAGALAFEQDIEDANKRLERFNQLKALLAS